MFANPSRIKQRKNSISGFPFKNPENLNYQKFWARDATSSVAASKRHADYGATRAASTSANRLAKLGRSSNK